MKRRLIDPLALVSRRAPLAIMIPGLIIGQVVGMWTPIVALGISTFLAVLLIWIRRLPRPCVLFIPGVISVIGYCGWFKSLPDLSNQSLTVQISSEPRYNRINQVAFQAKVLQAPNELPLKAVLECRGVYLPWRNSQRVEDGDIVNVVGDVHPIPPQKNPFSYETTMLRHGVTHSCKLFFLSKPVAHEESILSGLRHTIVTNVQGLLGSGERSGLLLSMAIGTRDVVSQHTEDAFKKTGLSDLLVVSGYQVMLVFVVLFGALYFLLSRIHAISNFGWAKILSQWIAVFGALAFVSLVGCDGSSVRAAIAVLLATCGGILERGGGIWNSISASAFVLCLLWPGCFCEPGIELTFAALIGIALGVHGSGGFLAKYIKVHIFGSLGASCVALLWFGDATLLGFLIHPLLGPIMSLISCEGGFLSYFAYTTGIDRSGYLLFSVSRILEWCRDLVIYLSELPGYVHIDGAMRILVALPGILILFYVGHRQLRQYFGMRGLTINHSYLLYFFLCVPLSPLC